MLIASAQHHHYGGGDAGGRDLVRMSRPPRPKIISEIRKSWMSLPAIFPNRPKLTGELLIKYGQDKKWWLRRTMIRAGQLCITSNSNCDNNDADKKNNENMVPSSFRLPLRDLSLQAGNLTNSLSLCRGQSIILTLQTTNEQCFDIWVKAIAIELIRQTPLDAVKYLDILTLTECWKRNDKDYCCGGDDCWTLIKPLSNKNVNVDEGNQQQSTTTLQQQQQQQQQQQKPSIILSRIDSNNNNLLIEEKKTIEDLLKKCRNCENYVPVKDKLVLFESLSKLGRKVRSSEDVSLELSSNNTINNSNNMKIVTTKRARSMYDLSSYNSHVAVRDICQYFEKKNEMEIGGGGDVRRGIVGKNRNRTIIYNNNNNNKQYVRSELGDIKKLLLDEKT